MTGLSGTRTWSGTRLLAFAQSGLLVILGAWSVWEGFQPQEGNCGLFGCLDFRDLARILGTAFVLIGVAVAALGVQATGPSARAPWRILLLAVEVPIAGAGLYGLLNIAEGLLPLDQPSVVGIMAVGVAGIGLSAAVGRRLWADVAARRRRSAQTG